jgi:hypothetical protein
MSVQRASLPAHWRVARASARTDARFPCPPAQRSLKPAADWPIRLESVFAPCSGYGSPTPRQYLGSQRVLAHLNGCYRRPDFDLAAQIEAARANMPIINVKLKYTEVSRERQSRSSCRPHTGTRGTQGASCGGMNSGGRKLQQKRESHRGPSRIQMFEL